MILKHWNKNKVSTGLSAYNTITSEKYSENCAFRQGYSISIIGYQTCVGIQKLRQIITSFKSKLLTMFLYFIKLWCICTNSNWKFYVWKFNDVTNLVRVHILPKNFRLTKKILISK